MSVASLEKGVEPLIKTVYRGWVIMKVLSEMILMTAEFFQISLTLFFSFSLLFLSYLK